MKAACGQHGATTLVTVMLLFFVMALVAAYASRNLVIEQRLAQQVQAQAAVQEAGLHGLQRLLIWLNSGALNARCEPAAVGDSLRERLLRFDALGRIGVPAAAQGSPLPSDAPFTLICDRRLDADWQCQCPLDLRPQPLAADGQARESMLLRIRPFQGDAALGRLGLTVQACGGASADCLSGRDAELPLAQRLQAVALLPALKMPPQSALVATGDVDLGDGLQLLHNDAAQGGVALQAGGAVSGERSGVQGPAGSEPPQALLERASALAALDADALFHRHVGLTMAEQLQQPAFRRLDCERSCASALLAQWTAGHRLLWHEGDLLLDQDLVAGSAEQPLLLVVRGDLRIAGPLRLHGLVFVAGNLNWLNPTPDRSVISGAVLVAGTVQAHRGATVVYDAGTLQSLRLRAGSLAFLPGGSWSRPW